MKGFLMIARIVLGIYLMVNGLNFFFHFLEFPPVRNEVANILMQGFVKSGMFEFVKVAEVTCGLALVLNMFVPVALAATFPIVVIIGYIDVFILRWELGGIVNGGGFFAVYTVTMLLYLPYYRSMFVLRAEPDPTFSTLRRAA